MKTFKVRHYNAAIYRAGQLGSSDYAMEILTNVLEGHYDTVNADLFTFSSAIKAAGMTTSSSCGWRRARAILLEDMPRAAIKPDVHCYTAAISACSRSEEGAEPCDAALEILAEMKSVACAPNAFTYSAAMAACKSAGRWAVALDLLGEMRASSAPVTPFVWTAAITACGRAGQWEAALDVLGQMRDMAKAVDHVGVASDTGLGEAAGDVTAAYNAAITACGRAGQWEAALTVFHTLRAVGKPDAISYNAAMSALERAKRFDDVDELFAEMVAKVSVSETLEFR